MSAGARVRDKKGTLNLADLDIGAKPPEGGGVRAFAETETGIHAIQLEDALARFERCRAVESPTDLSVPLVWIDIAAPTEAEEALLRDRMHFHPLAVEDCVRGRQRPKLDRYPGYYFLVFYAAAINEERERMALHEVHVFIGRRYVVTVHDHEIPPFHEVLIRWRASPESFRTVGALAHAIVDTIVDGYFPVLDHFAERVDEVEERIFDDRGAGDIEEVLSMRRELTVLRRVLGPERELLGTLVRRDLPFLSPELALYYQDVYDHAIRVVEETENLRDLLGVAIEAQMSIASNQLNVTMRVMAAWSIILMGMTLVAGVYGMNFVHMPELHWPLGYAWAVGLMLAIGFVLFMYFRRQRWI
jgi:magnesium transporter